MTFDEYQVAAARTRNASLSQDMALAHDTMGIVGETGEACTLILAGEPGARILTDELSDIVWYCASLTTTIGERLSRVATLDEKNLHRYRSLGGRDLAVELGISAARICERAKKSVFHARAQDILGALGEHFARVLTLAEDRGISFREIAEHSESKLRRRYPDGFQNGGGLR